MIANVRRSATFAAISSLVIGESIIDRSIVSPTISSMSGALVIGDWTVTPALNLLARGEEETRVEPRVMDVLVCLAEQPNTVISKDDLIARVWEGRHVTDDVLTVTIYGLRRAL